MSYLARQPHFCTLMAKYRYSIHQSKLPTEHHPQKLKMTKDRIIIRCFVAYLLNIVYLCTVNIRK